MRAAAAAFFGLSASLALAAEPANFKNIVFEWVTVTACPCSASSTTLESISTHTVSPTISHSGAAIASSDSLSSDIFSPRVNRVVTSVSKPSSQPWATTATAWDTSASSTPTPAMLKPAVLNQNLANPENLRPNLQHDLYYADNSNAGVDGASMPVANVKLNFTMDTVNLESSSHISSVTCSSNPSNPVTTLMKVVFRDKTAYDTAMSTWPKDQDFLVIGYFPGCGSFSSGKRTVSKVHELSIEDSGMEITLEIEDLPLKEAITAGDIKFGSFNAGYMSGSETPSTSNGTRSYTGVGVPADCLGEKTNDFDVQLDNELGVDRSHPSIRERFRAKREIRNRRRAARESQSSAKAQDNNLEKRWSIGGFFSDIGSAISSAVSTVVDTVKDAAEAAWDGISGAMKDIGEAILAAGKVIIGTVADFDYIDTTAKWNLFLPQDQWWPSVDFLGSPQNTPWGKPGFLLMWTDEFAEKKKEGTDAGTDGEPFTPQKPDYAFAPTPTPNPDSPLSYDGRLYCVNCGFSGNLKFNGHIVFSLKDGLQKSTFVMNGTMHSNLQLGFQGWMLLEAKVEKVLFSIPLTPFYIPEILDLGPQIVVKAQASASIESDGLITAGVAMDWSPYIEIDMMDLTANSKGWDPVLHPTFELEGEIVAAVGIALPITLGFGLTLFEKWSWTVGLTEKPGLRLSAREAGKAVAGEEEAFAILDGGIDRPNNFTCPNGVSLFFDFINNIDFEIVGKVKKPLGRGVVPIWQQCIGGDKPKATSTALLIEPTPEATSSSTPLETSEEATEAAEQLPALLERRQVSRTSMGKNETWSYYPSAPSNSTSTATASSSAPNMNIWSTSVVTGSSYPTLSVFNTASSSSPRNPQASPSATITDSILPTVSEDPLSKVSVTFSNNTIISSYVTQTSTSSTAAPTPTHNFAKATLQDAVDGLFINTNADGTMFLCNGACGKPAKFYVDSDVIVADTHERVIHFYSNEMKKYGVSRLRLHSTDKLPNRSAVVGLVELSTAKIVAMTPGGGKEFLFPVACRIEGSPTKIFVVKDPKEGIDELKKLEKELVGGKVLECSLKNLRIVGEHGNEL